jgi:Winged helix-turn helix
MLAALLQERFGVKVTGRTISGHLKKLGLSYQKPRYRAVEQNPEEEAFFLEEKFPRIQRLAEKLGADIAFELTFRIYFSRRSVFFRDKSVQDDARKVFNARCVGYFAGLSGRARLAERPALEG